MRAQINRLKKWVLANVILLFVLLLMCVIFTRLARTYANHYNAVRPAERFVAHENVADDLRNGVVKCAILMMNGEKFYVFGCIYGPALSVVTIPILQLAQQTGFCFQASCTTPLYQLLLLLTIGGYVLFIFRITGKDSEPRIVFLVYLMLFLLGIPGSLGLERGNIDIIYSLLFGLLLMLSRIRIKSLPKSRYMVAVLIGLLLGFLTNSKLFFLPFSLIFILSAETSMLIGYIALLVFWLFMFLPKLYGAPGTLTDLLNVSFYFDKNAPFITIDSMSFNHSFAALASLATDCIYKNIIYPMEHYKIIGILSKIFLIFTFVLPTVTYISRKTVTNLGKTLAWIIRERRNEKLRMLAIVYTLAAINLLPSFSINYRLYYSLPVLFFLWLDTKSNASARWNLILSMIFLGFKGLWLLTGIEPRGMTLIDVRIMNIFVLLHFFFMIKAALASVFRPR
jgi:hypothetical protein